MSSDDAFVVGVLQWLPVATIARVLRETGATGGMTAFASRVSILEPMKLSTMSLGTDLSNVRVHEEHDIHRFANPPRPILFVGSNFGEHATAGFTKPPKYVKTTNRGRKRKEEKPKQRKRGTGEYMGSQITFWVAKNAARDDDVFKVKVFRTGNSQIPGVRNADWSDVRQPINDLCTYLGTVLDVPVEPGKITIQFMNWKTTLVGNNLYIKTVELGEIIQREKRENTAMQIASVEYRSSQNSSKIIIKLRRPTKKKPKRQTTVKIMKQKINFEAYFDYDDLNATFRWLNRLIISNYNRVVCDNDVDSSDSSDTDSDSSDSSDSHSDRDTDRKEPAKFRSFDPYAYD